MEFITGYGKSAWNLEGKQVVYVDNLNDSGPGSLRDAVSQPNRVVLFNVGGQIDIQGTLIVSSNVVICAFTAPGEYGIVVKGPNGIQYRGDNIASVGLKNWVDRFSGSVDSIQVNRGSNVLVAMGSSLFATDEALSTYAGGVTDTIAASGITFYNMIATAADNSSHGLGGMMNGKGVDRVDYIRCVAAFNRGRNFKLISIVQGSRQRGNQYNCIVNEFLNHGTHVTQNIDVNIAGNWVKGNRNQLIADSGAGVYESDNNGLSFEGSGFVRLSSPMPISYVYNVVPSAQVFEELIISRKAGWKNTPLEEAILANIEDGSLPGGQGVITNVSQLGGWPAVPFAITTHQFDDLETYLAGFFDDQGTPPVNTSPVIEYIPDFTIDKEDNIIRIPFIVTDDGEFTTHVSSSDSEVVDVIIDGNDIVATRKSASGVAGITLSADDGEFTDSKSFTIYLEDNTPPPPPVERIDLITGVDYELYHNNNLIANISTK